MDNRGKVTFHLTYPVNLSDIPISFNETDIKRMTTKPKFKSGCYRFRIVSDPTPGVNDKGNMRLEMTLNAVDDTGQSRGPSKVKFYLTYPVPTPPDILEAAGLGRDFKQAKIPNTLGQVQQFLRATFSDDFDMFPKRAEETGVGGAFLYHWQGQLISNEERQTIIQDVLAPKILKKLSSLWAEPSQLTGIEFYGMLEYQGNWTRIKWVSSREPDSLVDLDDCYSYGEEGNRDQESDRCV